MEYLIAALAGFVLNFMPCVFPVVGLKLMHLTQSNCKMGGTLYTLGCVLIFTILGGLFLFAKGSFMGWGFQMTNPIFVGAMAVIFLFLALWSFNLIWIPHKIDELSARLATAVPLGSLGAIVSGILAPLVASSCMAPFLGAALGSAVLFGGLQGLLIFSCIGFGMAAPFLLLDLFPSWNILPKSGPWLIMVKRISGVLLLLTSAYFFYILIV